MVPLTASLMQLAQRICVLVGVLSTLTASTGAAPGGHPCLLFTEAELPALRLKVADGGADDDAYALIRDLATISYPGISLASLTGTGFALEVMPNLGIAAHFPSGGDSSALALGRDLTLYIADTFAVDFDEAASGLRLRALALGYDLFFGEAPDSLRARVRLEMESYLLLMARHVAYEVFEYRPYIGNHGAMFAAAMGLAAICLDGESDPALLADAIARADRICQNLFLWQIDADGAYKEGALYGAWTMHHLVYYFHARKRFDGVDLGAHPRVRAMERWFAYELLPEGSAATLNLNDSNYNTRPLARNATYFDWATGEWQSGLCAWIRERVSGAYGLNMWQLADNAATVIWYRPIPAVHPGTILATSRLFLGRGLYHFRTGWPVGASSDDLVFAFFSGKFQGGHWQEDIGQFVLHGYGASFVVDHGAGSIAKQSESHNIVFVDGAGQHNAGGAIGTDGEIAAYLMNGFADHLLGDATAAYTTHSALNNPGMPLPGLDWSWGYHGANPVERAQRRVLAVHGGSAPPYFVVMDDVDKDGQIHAYQWRMHTLVTNTVDAAADPAVITAPNGASMRMWLLAPSREAVSIETSAYDNGNGEPDSKLLRVTHEDTTARFTVLLLPLRAGETVPSVSSESHEWGATAVVGWDGETVDYFVRNDPGATVTSGPVTTDARAALVRWSGGAVSGYVACDATHLSFAGAEYVRFNDGRATGALSGAVVRFDRYDADFRFLDTGITAVYYRDQNRSFVNNGGFLVPGGLTGVDASPVPASPIAIDASPNPFNPFVRIRLRLAAAAGVELDVYDARGRWVRALWRGRLEEGTHTFAWKGDDHRGARVASGVYFVRARAAGRASAVKVTLVE
ncbi:MAG: heparinase II/III family protein [Candidatus Krumholzibacteria bacterium]|nr:heparinase II/III family protein [Candidatus Krumholzibacteria bacterium]